MPYSAVPAAPFSGGLNLRDSYDQMDPAQAYDLLNVTFDTRGGVKSRDGYAQFAPASGSATARFDSMIPYYLADGSKQLVCGAGNRLEVYGNDGALVPSPAVPTSTAPTANPHYFCRFGGAAKTVVYAANGTDQIREWNGSAWSSPSFTASVTPTGKFLAVTPWDNRLVNASFTGTTNGQNPSSVRFSDELDPYTWATDAWVALTPGDGEKIRGVATFDNYMFVFKETKFFVFHGTSTAPESGAPVFNYRAVEAGIGLVTDGALTVGTDGVYFLAADGVYKTNGGYPEAISQPLDPLFTGEAPSLYTGSTINFGSISKARVGFHDQKVLVALPTGSQTYNDRVFVWDLLTRSWTAWSLPASCLASFKASTRPELVFGYATGNNRIGKMTAGTTTDAGTGINSFIKMAFTDLGDPEHKTIRESKVWGYGKIRYALVDDFSTAQNVSEVNFAENIDKWADGTDSSDKWQGDTGTDTWGRPAATRARLTRRSIRGAFLSIELRNTGTSATPGAWAVSKIIHHVRDKKIPSTTGLDGE